MYRQHSALMTESMHLHYKRLNCIGLLQVLMLIQRVALATVLLTRYKVSEVSSYRSFQLFGFDFMIDQVRTSLKHINLYQSTFCLDVSAHATSLYCATLAAIAHTQSTQ